MVCLKNIDEFSVDARVCYECRGFCRRREEECVKIILSNIDDLLFECFIFLVYFRIVFIVFRSNFVSFRCHVSLASRIFVFTYLPGYYITYIIIWLSHKDWELQIHEFD